MSFDMLNYSRNDGADKQVFNEEASILALLTNREKEVLKLLRYGMSKRQIAEKLFITINTTKTHVSSIYTKMGVHNCEELFKIINQDKP